MDDKTLGRALDALAGQPSTVEDWRDLADTIEGYRRRCLARAIAKSPQRDVLMAAIKERAEAPDYEDTH